MRIKEILVLHHSHFDLGYTHSQPIIWEMHREYIDQMLDLLDQTADWPDEDAKPKWTCEVTDPLRRWLKTASAGSIERFKKHVKSGRIAVAAMRFHITPMMNERQLRRQLAPVAELREKLGAQIKAAIQHDITGVPWPLADVLLDHGIDLFIMAINCHLGGHVRPRPGVFRWAAPSGRELRVMNGNHYTMFDQICRTWERSASSMRKGLDEYLAHLERIEYPHDFLYLTTTAAPEMWDNSPPNLPTAKLIRKWNEDGLEPRIRYVTSEDLAARISALPEKSLPLQSGDWTDYWNFGCASTAADVARNRAAKRSLAAAEMIADARKAEWSAGVRDAAERCQDNIDLYDEHTWGYWDTRPGVEPCGVQEHLKSTFSFEGRELAQYLLTHELDALAENPAISGQSPDEILLVNPSPVARREPVEIPAAWRKPGNWLRCMRFVPTARAEYWTGTEICGPVEVPANGSARMKLADLKPAVQDERVFHKDMRTAADIRAFNNFRVEKARTGHAIIESPRHRLSYDPVTGRVLGLLDKELNWEALPRESDHALFDFVRERPNALVDGRREAYYDRDLEKEKYDQSCWKPWRAIREGATKPTLVNVVRNAVSISLERAFEAPGTNRVWQRITLRAESPVIEVAVEIEKVAYTDPEGIYFTIPLNLGAGWRAHFDTAGQPVELDAGQLPGACRNWFTADTFAAMHSADRGMALFCPDAPMVMAGGFHFGPPLAELPREANPYLLAWPLNNYWNTNYALAQSGLIRLRYGLLTHGAFDPAEISREAAAFAQPVIVHPVFTGA